VIFPNWAEEGVPQKLDHFRGYHEE
jgi:hypothetical protein